MLFRTSIFGAVFCLAHAAHAAEPPALTLFENVRIFDGKSEQLSASVNVLVRGNTIETISKDPITIDGELLGQDHRRRWAHAHAGPHRRALACDACSAHSGTVARGRCRLPELGGGRRGYGHVDARFHHRSRRGRAIVRAEARHRRGHRRRPAHLSIRRHYHRHQRSRRLPPRARAASRHRRPAVAPGADRSRDGRRQPG